MADDDWDDWGSDEGISNDATPRSAKKDGFKWDSSLEKHTLTSSDDNIVDAITDPGSTRPLPHESLSRKEVEHRDAERLQELTEQFFSELRTYQEDLADPSVRDAVNKALVGRDYASICGYYNGGTDLARYTIETELRRMRYTAVTDAGERIDAGNVNHLEAYLEEHRQHPMVAMANQSIFADMLEVLQGRLLRADLDISVISRVSEFTLNFRDEVLEALSVFGISTVNGDGREHVGAGDAMEIAQVKGTTTVDFRNETCVQQLLPPELRMVFDDDMRSSARVLARHSLAEEGTQGHLSSMYDRTTVDKGVFFTGSHAIGALRKSLARVTAAESMGILSSKVPSSNRETLETRTRLEWGSNDDGTIVLSGDEQREQRPGVSRYRGKSILLKEHNTSGYTERDPSDGTATVDDGTTEADDTHALTKEDSGRSVGQLGSLALGMASATGGAVFKGLWGGLRGLTDGAGQDPNDQEDRPTLRLYRRDGDDG